MEVNGRGSWKGHGGTSSLEHPHVFVHNLHETLGDLHSHASRGFISSQEHRGRCLRGCPRIGGCDAGCAGSKGGNLGVRETLQPEEFRDHTLRHKSGVLYIPKGSYQGQRSNTCPSTSPISLFKARKGIRPVGVFLEGVNQPQFPGDYSPPSKCWSLFRSTRHTPAFRGPILLD